jgi:LysR family transcriptional regulator, glycine cleavage system transcriptional activator
MNRALNLNWIRSFEAAARHLSFTDAAGQLNMTQAAVSKHVRLLEQVLGEPLFMRQPRALMLTDAGEAYLHVVAETLSGLRRGTDEIFPVRQEAGLVTVRCNMGFATYWLASRIEAFLDAHPGISVRLLAVVHGSDIIWEGIDMELRYDSDRAEGLEALPFRPDYIFPVCSPAVARRLETPADLLRERLLHVIGNRHGWSEWLALAGVEAAEFPPDLQVDTSAISLALAEAGAGVALGHSSLVTDLLHAGRLVRPFAQELAAHDIYHLIRPAAGPQNAAADAFATWLMTQADQD